MPTFQPIKVDPFQEHVLSCLAQAGFEARINSCLAGGVISNIFAGISTKDGSAIVIKYTRDRTNDSLPFNPRVDHFISAAGHNLDTELLFELRRTLSPDTVIIPEVKLHLPASHITVMSHLGEAPHNMTLMSQDLSNAITRDGNKLGRAIAAVQLQLAKTSFQQTETSQEQFEERACGLLFHYRNKQEPYKRFMEANTKAENPMIPTDIHPKNILLNDSQWSIIDYGRTVRGDPDFVLPNFLSHILMNYTLGKIDEGAKKFFNDVIVGYRLGVYAEGGPSEIDESKFCFYAASEILGRSSGRWIDYINENEDVEKRLALTHLGSEIIKRGLASTNAIFALATAVRQKLADGGYSLLA